VVIILALSKPTDRMEQSGSLENCTTCVAYFASKEIKRTHMKDDWQLVTLKTSPETMIIDISSVYNLKRRIQALSPVSANAFQGLVLDIDLKYELEGSQQFQRKSTRRKLGRSGTRPLGYNHSKQPSLLGADYQECAPTVAPSLDNHQRYKQASSEGAFKPAHCLFCNLNAGSLDNNLAHMSQAHGFFIPNMKNLVNTSSLLGYLFILISKFHECLLCRSVKSNKLAIQDHMRDKGHCKVSFVDEGSELWEFYDFSIGVVENRDKWGEVVPIENIAPIPVNDELRLPSGKIIRNRSHRKYTHQNTSHSIASSLKPSTNYQPSGPRINLWKSPNESNSWQVGTRGMRAGMVGVPILQQQCLLAVERKLEVARIGLKNEYWSKVEKGGNRQKRFRVLTIGKKAGGLEKRLG